MEGHPLFISIVAGRLLYFSSSYSTTNVLSCCPENENYESSLGLLFTSYIVSSLALIDTCACYIYLIYFFLTSFDSFFYEITLALIYVYLSYDGVGDFERYLYLLGLMTTTSLTLTILT